MVDFLHGVEVIELDAGARPITTSKSSVIGLVGTAPIGPVNIPTLIAGSLKEAVNTFGAIDAGNTIPAALNAIFAQTGATVVVINVLDPSKHNASVAAANFTFDKNGVIQLPHVGIFDAVVKSTDGAKTYAVGTDYVLDAAKGTLTRKSNAAIEDDSVSISYKRPAPEAITAADISGGVDADGLYSGAQALLGAESIVHVAPRVLIAPGFTGKLNGSAIDADAKALLDNLLATAERLRAVVVADGPNSSDQKAVDFRTEFDNARLYIVDPYVKVYDSVSGQETVQPASAYVAGIIARSDAERGFWWSPSNNIVSGISGTARPIDFAMGDVNARANYLNENQVATIIHQDGYRLWGNRTTSSDPKWAFLSVRRTADLINDALLRAHLWAVDRNITRTYVEDVIAGVNDYLRYLQSLGAILGGQCWANPDTNTPDQIAQGKVAFDFDFTPPYPAEHITFTSRLVNNYLEEVFK